MALQVDIIDSVATLARVERPWIDFLARRAGEHTIFHDPRLFRAFIEKERGRSQPLCVLISRDGELACVAPFFTFDGRFKITVSVLSLAELPVRMLKLVGDSMVFARGVPKAELVREALLSLSERKDQFAYIALPELMLPNPIHNVLMQHGGQLDGFTLAASSSRAEKGHAHRMLDGYEAYQASLGAKKRKNIRRDTKPWSGAKGKGRMVRITRPDQVKAFLDGVEHIYPRTWQGKTFGYYRRSAPSEVRYLTAFAELGWLRCYLLELFDGTPVAFVIGYQGPTGADGAGGRFHYEDIGYDLAFASDHPGVALSYMMMDDLYRERPPELVDFGYGDNRYKEALSNEHRQARSLYLVASPRWRATLAAQRGLDRVYLEAKRFAQRAGIEARVRDIIKRRDAALTSR